ncbi:hypothetical protein [Bradyrhizobium brasilense]|nr:hypothetical protein [Bradyrhizobium brasilense]
MAQNGAGPMPAISTTRKPVSGPMASSENTIDDIQSLPTGS